MIVTPNSSADDVENKTQWTKGEAKNYEFKWKYACAFTKWVPTNQFIHDNQVYDQGTMTLERFGFIGMQKKCFWGMVAVKWVTPLKIEQIPPK